MKKLNALPKSFQNLLGKLKELDDQLGISVSYPKATKMEIRRQEAFKARDKLLNVIWSQWPRKTLLNKEVLQMRGNALKSPEVKAILNSHQIGVEDCALISLWGEEEHIGKEHDCPAHTSPEDIQIHLTKFRFGNHWRLRCDYYYGGPKDAIKILFKNSKNNRFKVVGIIQMFQEKRAA